MQDLKFNCSFAVKPKSTVTLTFLKDCAAHATAIFSSRISIFSVQPGEEFEVMV